MGRFSYHGRNPPNVERNIRLPCAYCGKGPRHWTSPYCHKHWTVHIRTGAPDGHTVFKSTLAPFYKSALIFLAKHRRDGHVGITTAQRVLKAIITEGCNDRGLYGHCMRRLSTARHWGTRQRTPYTMKYILAQLCSMWMLRDTYPGNFVSQDHFKVQMGRLFLNIVRPLLRCGKGSGPRLRIRVMMRANNALAPLLPFFTSFMTGWRAHCESLPTPPTD